MEKTNAYNTLQEIRLRKQVLLSEIKRNNQQINILWKDMFRKPEPKKKALSLSSIMTMGTGMADGFLLIWKLYRK